MERRWIIIFMIAGVHCMEEMVCDINKIESGKENQEWVTEGASSSDFHSRERVLWDGW
jgi:hypothetical protein